MVGSSQHSIIRLGSHFQVPPKGTKRSSSSRSKEARQQAFASRHGKEDASKLIAEVSSVRRLLKERDRCKQYVLHPAKDKCLSWWDLVTTLALLYTATVTPFETCFLSAVHGPKVAH